uniref:Uncharacterized protein n=1 Tax=Oryza meridionalis TaxID=40149 RepID=A0A0E0EBG4_9ORYZ
MAYVLISVTVAVLQSSMAGKREQPELQWMPIGALCRLVGEGLASTITLRGEEGGCGTGERTMVAVLVGALMAGIQMGWYASGRESEDAGHGEAWCRRGRATGAPEQGVARMRGGTGRRAGGGGFDSGLDMAGGGSGGLETRGGRRGLRTHGGEMKGRERLTSGPVYNQRNFSTKEIYIRNIDSECSATNSS